MLSRIAIANAVLLAFAHSPASAADHDHLQRGEEKLTADYQIKHDRAIRNVLSRGWRRDVVVRMLDIPPFEPETVVGIARSANGYMAFEVAAPQNLWYALALGSDDPKRKRDYRSIKPGLHERPLSQALSARIAALWRRVLADPRNYWKDPALYMDTNQFTYHLSFLPNEHLTAYVDGWGPRSEELIWVGRAIANHANGAPEKDLVKAVKKAETKLGI
jgi:hypothetical protein